MHEKIENLAKATEVIISSIPFSQDGKTIYTPFSEKAVFIEEVFEKISGHTFIAGGIKESVYKLAEENKINIIDILENEKLAVLNAIPTAEGAVQIAMEESETTIHDSSCLILGFGRIGKILAKMLNGCGAKVYCEARSEEDLSWIEACGYEKIPLENLDKNLDRYDYIFNTIPHMMLDRIRLDKIKEECLIIDLASKPGGVDFDYAKEKGMKAIFAPGLPGKVAPLTSAKYIKEVVNDILENKNRE